MLKIARYVSCVTRTTCVATKLSLSCGCARSSSSIATTELRNSWEKRAQLWLRQYEDLFGITKLAEMHDKVLVAQTRVQEIQGKRRKVLEDILSVQNKLQEIQTKLEKISRGDDIFLSIVTQEHELIKEQKHLQNLLAVYDRTEREEQTSLSLAINNSQDHERTYREKNKYLSLITGVIGGLIGVIGSSINNWRHRKDIKLFASDISTLIKEQNFAHSENQSISYETISQNVSKLEESFNKLLSPKSDVESSFNTLQNQMQELVSLTKTQETALSEVVQNVHSFITTGNNENIEDFYSDLFMKKIIDQVDSKMNKKIKSHTFATVGFMYSTLVLASVIIYIINTR